MHSESVSWRATRDEWKQHWRIGLAALVGSGLSYSIWINLSSLFVQPFQDHFGWTRGEIGLAHNATLVAALLAPACGRLIDRIGVRKVLLVGLTGTALCFISMSQMNGSLPLFYLIYACLAIVGLTTSGMSYTRIVCGAFVQSRGLALAVTRAGLAIAGAVLPATLYAVMSMWGWRAGIATMGGLMLVIALPLIWLWVPQERPQVASDKASDGRAPAAGRDWNLLKSRKVWTLCLAAALAYVPLVSSFSQLQPLLTGKGLVSGQAAGLLGLIGVSAIAGAAITGILVDRIWAPLVALIFTLLPCVGFALLLSDSLTPTLASVAILLLGIGYGAEADLLAYMAARYFGLKRYSTIYGFAVLFISVGTALGVSAIGLIHDRYQSYDPALWIAMGVSAMASLCYLSMGHYPVLDEEHASA